MSVKLRKRKNRDGSTTLFLDIYEHGKRQYEFLRHLRLSKPSGVMDRQKNKENLELAQKIAIERAHKLSTEGYSALKGNKVVVLDWLESYVDRYNKKDKRNMQGALNRFKTFLADRKAAGLTFGKLDVKIVTEFRDDLKASCSGEGANSYFARFKKMTKAAYMDKLLNRNPAAEVKNVGGAARKKDTLTMEEITMLANTPVESTDVRRAFLFSCVTGLRWCDVKALIWRCVNLENKYMAIRQSKTETDLRINLNETALALLGTAGKSDQLVFDLPTANGCNKTVKAWVKRAGIEKHITWHNARHSFGTNLIYMGTDIYTTSMLLGHSSLKHTQRYVKASNELKERATDKLNFKL